MRRRSFGRRKCYSYDDEKECSREPHCEWRDNRCVRRGRLQISPQVSVEPIWYDEEETGPLLSTRELSLNEEEQRRLTRDRRRLGASPLRPRRASTGQLVRPQARRPTHPILSPGQRRIQRYAQMMEEN